MMISARGMVNDHTPGTHLRMISEAKADGLLHTWVGVCSCGLKGVFCCHGKVKSGSFLTCSIDKEKHDIILWCQMHYLYRSPKHKWESMKQRFFSWHAEKWLPRSVPNFSSTALELGDLFTAEVAVVSDWSFWGVCWWSAGWFWAVQRWWWQWSTIHTSHVQGLQVDSSTNQSTPCKVQSPGI